MFDKIVEISLKYRPIVLLAYVLLLVVGGVSIPHLSVDVFPDLNKPTVSVLIEAGGLAPEELEKNITIPLENALNGATGVERISSTSAIGYGTVKAEFKWGTNIFEARQIVSEKIAAAQSALPQNVAIQMGPISSIMGEVMMIGLTGDVPSIDLRSYADNQIKKRLQSISGISNIETIGGELKTYLITLDPTKMMLLNVTLENVSEAFSGMGKNTNGGFQYGVYTERLVRVMSRPMHVADLEKIVLPLSDRQVSVTLGQIAKVRVAPELHARGTAGINGAGGVLITMSKQPSVDTMTLTRAIEDELDKIESALPTGMKLHRNLFRQADFIQNAINNISEALIDGAILIVIILFIFMLNVRTTGIILTVIPTSFVMTALVFDYFGLNINTMTLGGLAMGMGSLIDDAIVGVSNIYKRLKNNKQAQYPKPILDVVYLASKEIRNSIIFSSVLIFLVFIPLFALPGIEGKIFTPLAISFILSMVMSTVVAITLTPVLTSYLLPNLKRLGSPYDTYVVRHLKVFQEKAIHFCMAHLKGVFGSILGLVLLSGILMGFAGKEFLPPFNEGSFNVTLTLAPGTNLTESNRIGNIAEKKLLKLDEIQSVARKTGRAELNEHSFGVNTSEMEVKVKSDSKATKEELMTKMRSALDIPGVVINIGQPISHRIDFILSGVRSQIAIKIFGPDSDVLAETADEIQGVLQKIDGVTDIGKDMQIKVAQTNIRIDADKATRQGVMAGKAAEDVQTALAGQIVGTLMEEEQLYDIVLNMEADKIEQLPVGTIKENNVPLGLIADIREVKAQNEVSRENGSRKLAVYANVQGRDLVGAVEEIKDKIAKEVTLPSGYFMGYDGQFEAQNSASRNILLLGALSLILMITALYVHFKSWNIVAQLLLVVPLSGVGAVIGIYMFNQPISIASIIGFIALIGIAIRNGILLIELYLQHERQEGSFPSRTELIHLTSERLEPVMMTTLTSIIGFIPLIIAGNTAGKELLYPVAVVIVFGLITTTLFNLILTPVIYNLMKRFKI